MIAVSGRGLGTLALSSKIMTPGCNIRADCECRIVSFVSVRHSEVEKAADDEDVPTEIGHCGADIGDVVSIGMAVERFGYHSRRSN